MAFRFVIIFTLCLFHIDSLSQDSLRLIKSIPAAAGGNISVDRKGHFYLSDALGNIDKYDSSGNLLLHYSTERSAAISLMEASNPLRLFTFYGDFQEYQFHDRFLIPTETYSLQHLASFVGMATISADNNVWLIDYSDFSLKKYDVTFQEVVITQPLDLILDPKDYEITHLMEYQNQLLIADTKGGILVFDNLVNYRLTLEVESTAYYFNCWKNYVYYISNDRLIMQDLYSGIIQSRPLPAKAIKCVLLNDRLILYGSEDVKIYQVID